jgi:glycosyltransferase involved in cell wall biosynthesis
MNILLIPNNDWINHPVPAQRHYRIFEKLARKHNVYVMQFDIFGRSAKSACASELIHTVKPFTIPVSDPMGFYIVNLAFQGKKILSVMKELDIDLVFGSNLAVCTLGFKAARVLGLKTVFDLSDFFPASASAYYPETNRLSSGLMYSLASLITNHNIRTTNLCTTCSIGLQEYAKRVAPNTHVEHLPNGVDTQVFVPKPPDQRLASDLELDDNPLIYVGSIECWLDFKMVLDSISILKKEGTRIQLVVIGRGIYSRKENPLAQSVSSQGLEKQVRFLGYQPYERLPDFINLGIGGLIPFKTDSLLTQMAFPNKLIEYLACGKPVFAPPLRELVRVGGRYLLGYTSPKSLALQIKKAIASNYDSEEIRKSVLSYDWNIIAEKLDACMHGLN